RARRRVARSAYVSPLGPGLADRWIRPDAILTANALARALASSNQPQTVQAIRHGRSGRRSAGRLEAHDPEAVVHVVHVHEAILHDDAPRHRGVLDAAVHVGGVEVRDAAALGTQVAAQLAGDVVDVKSAVVGANVERIARDPHVVHAADLRLEPCDGARLLDVANVDHLESTERTADRCVLRTPHL